MLNPGEILIHAGNAHLFAQRPFIDGEHKGMGLVPRDFGAHPVGSMLGAPMATFSKIPRSEWKQRLADQTAAKARCSDHRNIGMNGQPIPSRDQNGYADLSAFAIGCIIKGYANQGGWNGESMKFLRERGCPTSEFWAQKSTQRSNDNPKTWENAALYKMLEWEDIPEGDFDYQVTCSLLGIPYALDLNWWSHSIAGMDLVDGTQSFNDGMMRAEDSGKLMSVGEFDSAWETSTYGDAFGCRIWNSWGDSWSDKGMGVLTEGKSRNNGAIACRVLRAAA
jgi:hypothetical protein